METGVVYKRISNREAQEIAKSISSFPVDDLVKLYLHISSMYEQYQLLRSCFDKGDYSRVTKDRIIKSILAELYSQPKDQAVTRINHNLNYYRMRREMRTA